MVRFERRKADHPDPGVDPVEWWIDQKGKSRGPYRIARLFHLLLLLGFLGRRFVRRFVRLVVLDR